MPDFSAPPPNLIPRVPPPIAGPRILPPSMIQNQSLIPPTGTQSQMGNAPPFGSSNYQYPSSVPPQVGGGIHGAPGGDRPQFGFPPPFGSTGPRLMTQNMGPTWEKPTYVYFFIFYGY